MNSYDNIISQEVRASLDRLTNEVLASSRVTRALDAFTDSDEEGRAEHSESVFDEIYAEFGHIAPFLTCGGMVGPGLAREYIIQRIRQFYPTL